MDHYQNISS